MQRGFCYNFVPLERLKKGKTTNYWLLFEPHYKQDWGTDFRPLAAGRFPLPFPRALGGQPKGLTDACVRRVRSKSPNTFLSSGPTENFGPVNPAKQAQLR